MIYISETETTGERDISLVAAAQQPFNPPSLQPLAVAHNHNDPWLNLGVQRNNLNISQYLRNIPQYIPIGRIPIVPLPNIVPYRAFLNNHARNANGAVRYNNVPNQVQNMNGDVRYNNVPDGENRVQIPSGAVLYNGELFDNYQAQNANGVVRYNDVPNQAQNAYGADNRYRAQSVNSAEAFPNGQQARNANGAVRYNDGPDKVQIMNDDVRYNNVPGREKQVQNANGAKPALLPTPTGANAVVFNRSVPSKRGRGKPSRGNRNRGRWN